MGLVAATAAAAAAPLLAIAAGDTSGVAAGGVPPPPLQAEWIEPARDIQALGSRARWPKGTPIVIINRDRLTYLQQLVQQLRAMGYHQLYILDNGSTYGPLLSYYRMGIAWVLMLGSNYGSDALWHAGTLPWSANSTFEQHLDQLSPRFVLTDSDLLFTDDAPHDWLLHFWQLMSKYGAAKVGAALKIDDLPSHCNMKEEIYGAECRTWTREVEPDVFQAEIDTTLALYRHHVRRWRQLQWCRGGCNLPGFRMHLRVAGPYIAKHVPWYENPAWLPHDVSYYEKRKKYGASFGVWSRVRRLGNRSLQRQHWRREYRETFRRGARFSGFCGAVQAGLLGGPDEPRAQPEDP